MFITILFYLLAAAAVGGAIMMILQKNPLISALYLVVTFCSIGFIYFMLNAELIGIFQIIVYAGAIMVLIVFVIMLLNLSHMPGISFRIIFTKLIGFLLAVVLIWSIIAVVGPAIPSLKSETDMFTVDEGKPPVSLTDRGDFESSSGPETVKENNIKKFGWDLFSKWVYPFEILSVILLVGVIGAIFFSRREVQ
jgi:NADH-quinone oxidoreductase subunit J